MAEPKDAASLILQRQDGRVLLGVRSRALAFLGGYAAFAGGRVDPGDDDHAERLFGARDLRATGAATREMAPTPRAAMPRLSPRS